MLVFLIQIFLGFFYKLIIILIKNIYSHMSYEFKKS